MAKGPKRSPSARSTSYLEGKGWAVWNVECRRGPLSVDLFNMFDLLAIRGPDTMGIQVTTSGHLKNRITKMEDNPLLDNVREAGWRIEAHGWMYSKRSLVWECRIIDLS